MGDRRQGPDRHPRRSRRVSLARPRCPRLRRLRAPRAPPPAEDEGLCRGGEGLHLRVVVDGPGGPELRPRRRSRAGRHDLRTGGTVSAPGRRDPLALRHGRRPLARRRHRIQDPTPGESSAPPQPRVPLVHGNEPDGACQGRAGGLSQRWRAPGSGGGHHWLRLRRPEPHRAAGHGHQRRQAAIREANRHHRQHRPRLHVDARHPRRGPGRGPPAHPRPRPGRRLCRVVQQLGPGVRPAGKLQRHARGNVRIRAIPDRRRKRADASAPRREGHEQIKAETRRCPSCGRRRSGHDCRPRSCPGRRVRHQARPCATHQRADPSGERAHGAAGQGEDQGPSRDPGVSRPRRSAPTGTPTSRRAWAPP